MKFGFVLPGGTATEQLELAVVADQAGWDGVFVWEGTYAVDAWTLLAAMAQRTTRVKLGTMLTPLPFRRPWKLASQVVTLDQLSGGRAILAIGLGAGVDALGEMGEETDRRIRAEMMDEGIDLIAGLWQGQMEFKGKHYRVDLSAREDFFRVAQPVQKPRIPIWVVGAWPRPKSMRRVLRCDGILPAYIGTREDYRPANPDDIRAMLGWLREHGGAKPGFDVITEGETPADDPAQATETVRPWAEAGCTWWIETRWELPHEAKERQEQVRQRLLAGPPRLT